MEVICKCHAILYKELGYSMTYLPGEGRRLRNNPLWIERKEWHTLEEVIAANMI